MLFLRMPLIIFFLILQTRAVAGFPIQPAFWKKSEASCVPLGSGVSSTTSLALTLPIAVSAGSTVFVAFTSGKSNNFTVTDSKSNVWTEAVSFTDGGSSGQAAIYFSTITTALAAGDSISASLDSSSTRTAIWACASSYFKYLDQSGTATTGSNITAYSVSSGSVNDANELVIGAFGSGNTSAGVTYTLGAGYTESLQYGLSNSGGVLGYKIGKGLSGAQTFTATASLSTKFSGVIATFSGGAPANPSNFSLAHTANNKNFTVSWTAGRGNNGATGCKIQYQNSSAAWVNITDVNCDATVVNQSISLPANGWYGAAWSSLTVRVIRNSDSALMGTFTQHPTCSAIGGSATSTTNIDEDCDNNWNNTTGCSYAWSVTNSTTYSNSTFAACTNATTYATRACNATAANQKNFTVGGQTSNSPAAVWSSSSAGSACSGSYVGAVEWTCTPSGCTYY